MFESNLEYPTNQSLNAKIKYENIMAKNKELKSKIKSRLSMSANTAYTTTPSLLTTTISAEDVDKIFIEALEDVVLRCFQSVESI